MKGIRRKLMIAKHLIYNQTHRTEWKTVLLFLLLIGLMGLKTKQNKTKPNDGEKQFNPYKIIQFNIKVWSILILQNQNINNVSICK